MSTEGELSGAVAIVTGASYGLGQAITEELLRRGATVMLTDIIDRVQDTTASLAARGYRVAHTQLDVTRRDSVREAVAQTVARFGRLDIFVNNAGWSKSMDTLLDLTEEAWDRSMDINIRGTLFCIQAAAETMIAQGDGGRIISISSLAGMKPVKRAAAYCTSKAAIMMLVKTAALELGEHRITVNCVAPGSTTTETSLAHRSGAINAAFAEEKRLRDARMPISGYNDPSDIAAAVAYFASPAARRATGQVLVVDGGALLA